MQVSGVVAIDSTGLNSVSLDLGWHNWDASRKTFPCHYHGERGFLLSGGCRPVAGAVWIEWTGYTYAVRGGINIALACCALPLSSVLWPLAPTSSETRGTPAPMVSSSRPCVPGLPSWWSRSKTHKSGVELLCTGYETVFSGLR